jgi:Ca2+-binding EF-hand superfamily protein
LEALAKIKDEIHHVYQRFLMFDLNPEGPLACFQFGMEEFAKVMLSTGQRFSPEELERMMAQIDEDGEGNVCFAEFAELMTGDNKGQLETEIELRYGELTGLFQLVDSDGGGSVDFEEMSQILQLLGRAITAEDLEELMAAIDVSAEEEIGFDRFVRLMASGATELQRKLVEQLAQFREAFSIFDRTDDGSVDAPPLPPPQMRNT